MENAKGKRQRGRTAVDSIVVFTKRLRDRVRSGEITCSVRIWQRPHVTVGGRYPMDDGSIVIDSIESISFADITPELARESGFNGVIDLLKVAKHGKGEYVYLIRFHYLGPSRRRRAPHKTGQTRRRE